jgi:sn-glycerol 3-phosphate transport system substrate-binding protein
MRGPRRALAVIGALVLALSACSGGGDDDGAGPSGVDPADCGLEQFASADRPVRITFWHTMGGTNADWLAETTAEFNRSQDDVRVRLVQFPNYQDLLAKYRAGLSTGNHPDLFQPEDTTVQFMLDSRSTVPMQACVDADGYSLEQFLPRATAFYSYQGVLHGMPWSISNPILFFNAAAFRAAGLDPADPPQTLDEVREYSEKIVSSGAAKHGVALRVEPYIFEFINAKSGGTYVNNGNGRDARATTGTLETDTARAIFTWWNEMVNDGLGLDTGGAPGNIDHMLALGNLNAAMAFEASGVLGRVRDALESGQYRGVEIGAGPLPALTTGGGVPVGDGSLWIPKASDPAHRGAAWQFVKFLSSAEQQAALAVEGGYVPARTDATTQPALVEKWNEDPIFRVAYDQLEAGPVNDATVGPLIGDYQGVRDAVKEGFLAMLNAGRSPAEATGIAQRKATAAIERYNQRIGA